MGLKVRIRGINMYIRDLAKVSDGTFNAARSGIKEAAEYLKDVVVEKIGVYQPTGGDPGGHGRWKKLKYDTIKKKLRKYGVGDKPLLASGSLKGSFSVIPGGKGRLSASVGSSSDYLVYHVYGAPGAHVPMRDPIRVTALEEKDMCFQIIEDAILEEIDKWW